jgi:hypothetical protein
VVEHTYIFRSVYMYIFLHVRAHVYIIISIKTKHIINIRDIPAHEMPTAMHAPHRTCGLKDSASSLTKLGTTSGVLNNKKPTREMYTI